MTRFLVGTSGWHYDHWRGVFYPPGTPRSRWLDFYGRHFPTVEVNNTFYRLPSESAVLGWKTSAPVGFVFAVKASRFVTHIKRLQGVESELASFLGRVRALGDKLGPVLYQTPPQMKRDEARLEQFLALLPTDLRHVFEFRNESWFVKPVYDALERHAAAVCVYDMPGFTSPALATAEHVYFRFHGASGLYSSLYDDAALGRWARTIRSIGEHAKVVYVYFNNDAQGNAVRNAATLSRLLQP